MSGPLAPPAYADLWQYTPHPYRMNYNANDRSKLADQSSNPFIFSGGEKTYGMSGGGEGGGNWGEIESPITMQINDKVMPEKYKGFVKGFNQNTQNYDYDLSKLPNGGMTKFKGQNGKYLDVIGTTSLGTGSKPDWSVVKDRTGVNKNLAYYDPNYGWITPTYNVSNTKEDATDQKIMAGLQAAAGLAFGAATPLMPGLIRSGIGAAQTIGNGGNWKNAAMNIVPGLIGAGLGAGGFNMPSLPPALMQALKYAQYAKQGYGMYRGLRGH